MSGDLLRPVRATRYKIRDIDGVLIDIPGHRSRGYFIKHADLPDLIDRLQDLEDDLQGGDQ